MTDVWTLLSRRRRSSPGAPLVTYVSGSTGQRVELSATSMENAAAKIANALRDEFDLEPGSRVGIHLPLHWQRAAWCAGVWTAGCIAEPDADPGAVDLLVAGVHQAELLASSGRDIGVVSLHPFGLPLTDALPPNCVDVTLGVRQQPDAYLFEPPDGAAPALRIDGTDYSQAEVLDLARQRALQWGLAKGGCLLVDESAGQLDSWLAQLAVPLAMGASVVLAHGPQDLERVAAQEQVTARIG